MFLKTILETKRHEVECLRRKKPLPELQKAALDASDTNDFAGAVSGKECAIIAEVKKRSPSKGIIRNPFDPVEIACHYEQKGAAAISVLTDEQFFGGHGSYMASIRKMVKLPLLRKDFIIDICQIYETKILGADAILLIAAILDRKDLKDFIMLAESLGLSSLVEVHTIADVEKALAAGANILGINNRDLVTFVTDLNVSRDLISSIPDDITAISESGIVTRQDIEMLMKVGINTFLIGETLMTAEDTGAKLDELLGRG
ncbi:MAG: indole-3-glycerol phosphate synthase TrpC [Deltaproteobacteria bacterium]|nr:indole-3-glycerol phosphate synthase TrpC [Deltaproteobacteria bacterium]